LFEILGNLNKTTLQDLIPFGLINEFVWHFLFFDPAPAMFFFAGYVIYLKSYIKKQKW
jgi:hypothetical protein